MSTPPPLILDAPPLIARASGWCGRRYLLHLDDREVARLSFAWLKEKATLELESGTLAIYRTREPGRPWVLERDGAALARARKPSAFRDRFVLELGAEEVELRPRGWFSPTFELRRGDTLIGEVERFGVLGREVWLELPPEWPAALQSFVFFLARVVWNRHQAAASA